MSYLVNWTLNFCDFFQFVEKAPAAVVETAREQAAEVEEKIAIVRQRLKQMEAIALVNK